MKYGIIVSRLAHTVLVGLTLQAGFALNAAPVEINSGSGSYNLPSGTVEGVRFSGAAGSRTISNWNPTLTGFQWNGSDYTSGPVYGILNQTANNQNFSIVSINQSMIFDAGTGGLNFSSWGTNLKGNTLTLRANNSNISFTGSITSSSSGGALIVESGVSHISVGGPISTSGGNVDIYGGGTGNFNGTDLDGGNLTIHGNRSTTWGSTSIQTGGGDIKFLGDGNQTFNGQIITSGGDFIWTGSGDGNFNNNLSVGAGVVDLMGSGTLTFSNPVNTTTINGNINIGASQTVIFQNSVTTSGGSINIDGGATVTASNTINTGGGSINVSGAANLSTSNDVNTGGGSINVTSSGNVNTTGNINTSGGSIVITGDGDTLLGGWVTTSGGDIVLTGNGTTSLNNDPTLGSGQIIVIGGGTLILDADGTGNNTGGTRINVILEGGTFRTAGKDRYINTLTLSSDSRIEMGTTGTSLIDINTIALADNFNPYDGVSRILIENFQTSGDMIRFNSGSGVSGKEQYFHFEGDYGSGYGYYNASLNDLGGGAYALVPGSFYGPITVIPEPTTWFAATSLLLAIGWHARRRFLLK